MQGTNSSSGKIRVSFDLRLVVVLLLIVIAGMLAMWMPWSSNDASGRTITVSGEAKITSDPDEFTFYPSYEFKDANKETALAALTAKSDEIVKKLKELGVASSKIKTNADGYDYRNYYLDEITKDYTYSLRPTVVVGNREVAQKVQDYLVTTSPSGQVTPQPGFSDSKRKVLENKARDEATKDARSKADQSAKNLGFKVTRVKSIEDGGNKNGIMPYPLDASISNLETAKPASFTIQPGENDLTYSVTVVYFIR